MTANPELVGMIAEGRRLDAEGRALTTTGNGKGADETDARAIDLLWQISELPVTSIDDLALKLTIAAEAFMIDDEDEEHFLQAAEVPARFLYPAMREARRLAKEGRAS